MKIKILLAPSLIIITITMLIWLVYPAYTNGIDGVKEKRQKLADQRNLMNRLDSNVGNVEKLTADLGANSIDNAVVFSYLPENKEEEKIIDNLNSLAKDSTLSVLNISVVEPKVLDVIATTETGLSAVPLPGLNPNANAQTLTPAETTKADLRKLSVTLSVIGDYSNIKSLLGKIQRLKRFNKISTLEIKTLLKEDQSISDSLQANATLEFDYLNMPSQLMKGDINNAVFANGVFDKQVMAEIKNSRSINVNNVSPGQKGGNNPFVIAK